MADAFLLHTLLMRGYYSTVFFLSKCRRWLKRRHRVSIGDFVIPNRVDIGKQTDVAYAKNRDESA